MRSDDGEPATWVAVLLLTLGLLLFGAAVKQWHGPSSRLAKKHRSRAGWVRSTAFTIAKAGGAGFALSALNPKNVFLVIAAARRDRHLRAAGE